ncbi:hypothetical protein [Nocardioides sp.]|uniref:hypothetical protein n=1 Tax=Nocardioides sp. TaxID=35761 RepID=UPI002BAF8A10|nr:hypothetical protein [Nocardioides sp.]HSX69054.1 hypothetical protein [Nocardioides sp.]
MSRGRVVLLLRIVAALAAALVAVVVGLQSAGVWTPGKGWAIRLVVLAAVLAFLSTTATAVREYLAPKAERRREDAGQVLRTAFWEIWAATKVSPLDLGIAAYEVHRPLWNWPPRAKQMQRIYRERARNRMNTSGVSWAPGKGVIGYAVERQSFVGLDVDAAWSHLANASEATWLAQSDDVRLGLSFEEFKKLQGKHGVVVAMPIIDDDRGGRVVGCVALDGPAGSSAKLESTKVQRILGDASAALHRSVLRRSR